MARILAYTSPAMGHMLPISALLCALAGRGHTVFLRTLSSCVGTARGLGLHADAVDPRIEGIELDDWKGSNPRRALQLGVGAFTRRAPYEVADLTDAVAAAHPDAILVDVNCWGALSAAEVGGTPWACFSPYTPPLAAAGLPPFGLGLRPLPGVAGRMRDAATRALVTRAVERTTLPPVNELRAQLALGPVATMDEFLRRAPLLLIASGAPFQYPQTDWGDAVQLIGPCALDPGPAVTPDWLAAIERPIVLVSTSSERQADDALARTALTALAGEPVHVVVTLPAGAPEEIAATPNATVCRSVPHGAVLDRAVCAVTHGGMGVTQKALARGVPVCAVPYGRDQFEVARRVEVARCGTRLPATKLTPARLRAKVRAAMTMTDGVRRVAAGFAATGGTARGAEVFEQRVLGL
ncbi:glycosyltransferase [[Mycobacterium] wendilense]|uniref:Glycosyltransferase n=1 Tax=[Mycobacterium] wendilense TaxID=3064284 RepID=A0ABM9MFB4_9MYCO|nr:glycosyltransferase [Mycolicibacterium sp. MU0050]CAJ1583793.1 glycosyltransferase [Mycolicibacterium sp. MU0050]